MIEIIAAIFVIGILILFLELGHFFVAKRMGVIVEKFSIGFGPPLIRFKRGETQYMISTIPLGGYVKMAGEGFDHKKVKEGDFISKTPLQRMGIVLAGPGMSFFLPLVLFYMIFIIGYPTLTTQVGEVIENYPAKEVGIKEGDIIIAIDNEKVHDWEEMSEMIRKSYEKEIVLTIKRDNEMITTALTPQLEKKKDILGREERIGLIGVRPTPQTIRKSFGPIESLLKSIEQLGKTVYLTMLFFYGLLTGQLQIPGRDVIGGPVRIAEMAGEFARMGFMSLLLFTAIVSINLGIINLIPLPVLDGGHVMFLIIEKIKGRPVNEKVQRIAQQIMVFLLIGLMFFVTYNDLQRMIERGTTKEIEELHEKK